MWKAVPWYTPRLSEGRENNNQAKRVCLWLILFSGPQEEPENLDCGEKAHDFGRSGIFQPMCFWVMTCQKNFLKKKSVWKKCFSFCTSPKMPHPICLKFSRKLLLWHEIIYMKCKTDWFVVSAKLEGKTNWIVLLKRELGSHLWIITYLEISCLSWHFNHKKLLKES